MSAFVVSCFRRFPLSGIINVKWNGPKSKKINIVKDINNMFFDTMKNHASKGKLPSMEQDSDELDAHVVEAVSLDSSESKNESDKLINDEAQGNLDQILTRLHELEEKTRNESCERALLIDENKKMAAEINQLKSTVITLKEDNDRVFTLLDAKLNAWIEVEAKAPFTRYWYETAPVSKYHGTNLFTRYR